MSSRSTSGCTPRPRRAARRRGSRASREPRRPPWSSVLPSFPRESPARIRTAAGTPRAGVEENVRLPCSARTQTPQRRAPSWHGCWSRSTRSPPRVARARRRITTSWATVAGRARASRAPARRAARGTSRTRAGLPRPPVAGASPSSSKTAARLGPAARRAASTASQSAELVVAVVGVEDRGDDELRRDRPVPAVLLEAERDVVAAPAAWKRSSWAPRPNAIARPRVRARRGGRGSAGACPPRPCELGELAARREQGHARVAETERRQARRLLAELERERVRRGRPRRRRRGPRSSSVEAPSACAANASAKASTTLGADREARGRAVAAQALEVPGARGEAAVEVERRIDRPSPSRSRRRPAISTTGRWKRSTSREATMPITPSCQASSAST